MWSGGGRDTDGNGERTRADRQGREVAIAIALQGARGRMIRHLLWQKRRGPQQRQGMEEDDVGFDDKTRRGKSSTS